MAPGRRVTLVVAVLVVLVVVLAVVVAASWSGPTGSGPDDGGVAGIGEVRGDEALVLASGTVANVVDGDTVDLADGTRVRLAIVDTPEVHGGRQPCGREASAFTAAAVHGEQIAVLRPSTAPVTDRYDRVVGEVVRDDGWSLNVGLAAAGLGTVDERFTDEDPGLADRARAARADAPAPSCEAVAP